MNNASINIIKYVAKKIRSRINKNPISITVATENDDEISRNFLRYAKKSLQIWHLCSSIFRRRSGYYLLWQRIEMCKSCESVHNSFLDSQIKRTKLPRNYTNYQAHEILWFTMPVRPDINNLFEAMSILKIIYVKYLE